MSETLQCDLVTPAALTLSEQVSMVEVPGEMGDFGVLPGHAPFMSIIRPGVVSVHGEGQPRRFFITAGYAEVNPQGCTILAEHVRDLSAVTREEAQNELAAARRELEYAKDELTKQRAERQTLLAEIFLQAVEDLTIR